MERVPPQQQEARADEAQAQALVEVLRSVLHPEHVCRSELNGRWVVFVRHEEQTYCLLPLEYEAPCRRQRASASE